MKISVIIPVYNTEKYLSQCVDSVLEQTAQNLEIILVDDGATDGCPQMCDSYAAKDTRVRVIHKTNGGLSDARNKGIELASGEYTIFVDSDDYLTGPDVLGQLTDRLRISRADVLCYVYRKEDERTRTGGRKADVADTMPFSLKSRHEQLAYLFDHNVYFASACNKMIRTDILKEMKFETGRVSEDIKWCAQLLLKARSFDYLNCCAYCYRQRGDSISKSITDTTCRDLEHAILACCEIMRKSPADVKPFMKLYTAYQFATLSPYRHFLSIFPKKE